MEHLGYGEEQRMQQIFGKILRNFDFMSSIGGGGGGALHLDFRCFLNVFHPRMCWGVMILQDMVKLQLSIY